MKDLKTFTIIPYKNTFIKLQSLRSGKIIYRDYYLDLVTHEKVNQSFKVWFNEFDFSIKTFFTKPKIVHLFYEFGFLIEEISNDKYKNEIIAIDLEYDQYFKIKLPPINKKINLLNTEMPSFKNYNEVFKKGYSELELGNCYQFNLTMPFKYRFENNLSPIDLISTIWNKPSSRGAFGSATFIPFINQMFFSNSPECLFQLKENTLSSMPIKGTIPYHSLKENFDKVWSALIEDQKCESELFMIADLIRNDLSRIDLPISKVVTKKVPLIVPGLIHQYTHIDVNLSSTVKFSNVINKMFPGGSITGAPKKRVMKILDSLESRPRGFYCGSTILLFKEMKSASINIRSAEFNFDMSEFKYSAGGGITLKSTAKNEYDEMSYKVKSFISLLTP